MPDWLTNIPWEFWKVLAEMAPYLLLGFLVAGVLSVVLSAATIERHLGGRGLWPVIKAAALGVPLPLCSCSVIPVAASLRRHGAGRGATVAFLISTPQTGVDSIAATLGLLGPVFAIFRPVAALISGIVGGAITAIFDTPAGASHEEHAPACTDSCCSPAAAGHGRLRRLFAYGFVTLPRDIGRSMLLGLVVAALITAAFQGNDFFSRIVPPGPLQILVLMAAGIPVYVCATASIPIAVGLIAAGVSPGAAFAFLVTGPATNAATVVTVAKVMGWRTVTIYLLTMMVTAFLGGLLLDQMVTPATVQAVCQHDMIAWWKHIAGVLLLGVLAAGAVHGLRDNVGPTVDIGGDMAIMKLRVAGMTCQHCAATVRKALTGVAGVASAEVDVSAGTATVAGSALDAAALCQAVARAGYQAQPLES
ncbi:MAG: SO_0444 family Cu/Zn efflux transporter [Planctomycetota bacterium]|nr:SO_0444 family Cu/Zn efflux transporter [Planctomycetota bacterium]